MNHEFHFKTQEFDVYIIIKEDHIFVNSIGKQNNFEDAFKIWKLVAEKSIEFSLNKVLITETVEKPFKDKLDYYKFGKEISRLGYKSIKVAYHDNKPPHELNAIEAEVASNIEGINTKLFDTLKEAKEWLLGD